MKSNRSDHQAIIKCKQYMNKGDKWSVDIELDKYFDTVNHDKLIGLVKIIRGIAIIRKYLKANVITNGLINTTPKSVPQSGNLLPLLSSVMLNELDTELEK